MAETINISKFYSKQNEEEGKWYEPKVLGVGAGFEVLLYGPNSDIAFVAQDEYDKAKGQIDEIADLKAKNKASNKALAEFAAKLIGGIRGKNGNKLVNDDGTEVTLKDIPALLDNSPVIASSIVRYEMNQNNFLSD